MTTNFAWKRFWYDLRDEEQIRIFDSMLVDPEHNEGLIELASVMGEKLLFLYGEAGMWKTLAMSSR